MKLIPVYFLLLCFAASTTTGCVNNAASTGATKDSVIVFDPASAGKTITEKNEAFAKAFTTGDSAGMVNHYAVDGKIFPPNSEAVIGRPAISMMVSQYLKFGIKEFKDVTTALYGTEDNLVEEGTFFMGDGNGHTIDKGKYICVWRKVGGEWKAYSDIFNSNLPVPATGK